MDDAVSFAAAAVPPTASMTSVEVGRTEPGGKERITIPAKIVHAALIEQGDISHLWPQSAEIGTIRPMATDNESPESTQAIAKRLRQTRLAKGLTKAAWCRLVDITPQSWSNIEGGETSPAINRISIDQAKKVIRATGVDMNWIYQGFTDRLPHTLLSEINKLEAAERAAAKPGRKKA